MPLRLKLLVGVIVLVVAGLAVADVVTYTSLRNFLMDRIDAEIVTGWGVFHDAFAGPFEGPHGGGPGTSPLPAGSYGVAFDASGQTLGHAWLYDVTGPTPQLPSQPPAPGTAFTVGSDGSSLRYRVATVRVRIQRGGDPFPQQGSLMVAVPLREVDQTLGHLRLIAGLVSLGVLLALGFFSWWLVRRELRPLEEMGATAGAIAAGDLSRRVPEQDPRSEVGKLGIALNAMLAQIEVAFAERKASEDRLRRFLADASHELRTPLTSIRGYAELFRRGADRRRGDLEKSMRRIEEESARMGILVDDLLLLARLDQDRPLAREPVDLAVLATDAAADARAGHPDHDIAVDVTGPVAVDGDEARLRQVAANLVQNAMIHTPPGTPVTIRARAEGDQAIFEVEDRGPGLEPDAAARVFEPFYRADPSRDRATGGVGLGLSIVAAIIRAHHGEVTVRPTPGGGATFRVTLPMAASPRAEGKERPSPTEAQATSSR
jgi:two-component system OmpR family sensor kinase